MGRKPHNNGGSKRNGFRIEGLSPERRRQILEKNPHITPQDVGLLPDEKADREVPEKKKRARKPKPSRMLGTIACATATEERVFRALLAREETQAVIVHGKVYLCEQRSCDVDGIVVLETFPDGTFRGQLVDAKAAWGADKDKPHAERDALTRYSWVEDKYGMKVLMLTPSSAATREIVPQAIKKGVDDGDSTG